MRGVIIFSVLVLLLVIACLPERDEPLPELPGLAPFLHGDIGRVDAAIKKMSLEQKLGQLIIVARAGQPEKQLHQWVRAGRIGGVALSGLPLSHFLNLRDSLQRESPFPLLFTAMGGALFNNRFSDAIPLPVMDALQALPSDSIKRQVREIYLQQAEALGLNLVPAPYLSPYEQRIAFSEAALQRHSDAIAWLTERRMLSMADGFGAPQLLSPALDSTWSSLLHHFQHLAEAGLSGFCIDASVYQSPELPPEAVSRFFRGRLQFDGLLMAHLTADNQLDEILDSGVDLVVTHNGPGFVMDYLLAAYQSGELKEQELHIKLRRILLAKQWAGQPAPSAKPEPRFSEAFPRKLPASMLTGREEGSGNVDGEGEGLSEYFQDVRWRYWQRRFREESIVVAANPDSLLPFRNLNRRTFRIYHLGSEPSGPFDEAFGKYAAAGSWHGQSWEGFARQLMQLHDTVQVVLALHNFSLDSLQAAALLSLARRMPIALVNFQHLDNLSILDTSLAAIQAFEGGAAMQELTVQALFGGFPANGKLPYTLNRFFVSGQGIELPKLRLRYGLPEQAGIAPEKLVGIDAIVQTAMDEAAFPGCQVAVVKDGTVVYDKAMGFHTYNKERPVEKTDRYDIASITKAVGTTLAAMRLYEEGGISINGRLGKQMNLPRNSRLRNLTPKKLMTHQSGLQPHMPVVPYLLYRDMDNTDCSRYFCRYPSDTFSIQVADGFYFDRRYLDKALQDVHRLRPRYRYRYSDVNFVLMQQLVEEKSGAPLDSFLAAAFYGPLGLQHTAFRPLMQWDSTDIVPTQYDRRWRHQLIHGYVHDETAALLGGVAGNAGLFSTAEDLAVVFQMLLDGGQYGGEQYLDAETVRYFTSARHGNHRGLGFDKPQDKAIDQGKFPEQVSDATFGHTGFTGTCAWADPDAGLIYIFLSNRIHPDANNHKIFEKRIRERIHQVIYDALDTYVPRMPELAARVGEGMNE